MEPSEKEILWRQLSQNIELYKFYMELVVKFNVLYYAVTGAIISFFLAHPEIDDLKFSLILPFIMSIAFGGFFIHGANLMDFLRQNVFDIRDALKLSVAPDVGVLSTLLYIFSTVYFLIAGGCFYLFWKN